MNVTECCLLLLLIIGERVINATWQHITYLPANLGSHENYSNISASSAETCSYFCAKSRDCLGFTYSEPLKACGLANCVSSDTKPTNLIRATGYVVSTLDIDSTITSDHSKTDGWSTVVLVVAMTEDQLLGTDTDDEYDESLICANTVGLTIQNKVPQLFSCTKAIRGRFFQVQTMEEEYFGIYEITINAFVSGR
ncbi:hypothetical protein EB796_020206 [Bugula neritina]|uniref:Apple domain-containing protein n=1 Tax=Bugula neritina TaxID=10212 RepID=A0A7J7J7G4_BUGNE|nr:hypothetical protein EB796_020206 [Bugula neritina]